MKYEILLFDLVGLLVEESEQNKKAIVEAAGMSNDEQRQAPIEGKDEDE